MKTGYTVSQVMRQDVLCAYPSDKIIDCARIMAEKERGSVIICYEGKVLGIMTEQDLARKVMVRGVDPDRTPVEDVMSKNVQTISPENDIYDAMVLMGHECIKHLPVTKGGRLVGIISYKDIIAIQPELIELISFNCAIKRK